ncbi:MAG: glutathione S-transferase, partial [Gemmatimonadota bacterium]|nr:glutathione S-transferase [Gemmatimonadota bacterium]
RLPPGDRAFECPILSVDGLIHLRRWLSAIEARPAVQRGIVAPSDKAPVREETAVESARKMLV